MAYTKEAKEKVFKKICDRIEKGESLRSVLRDENMPSSQTFYIWLEDDSNKSKQYAHACAKRADSIFEEILEIADETSFDKKVIEGGVEITNNEAIQRSRLKIDARKWVLGKMNPTKYGDKTNLTIEDKRLSETERQAKIQELLEKAKKGNND